MNIMNRYSDISIRDGTISALYRYSECAISDKIPGGIAQPLHLSHILHISGLIDNLLSYSSIYDKGFHLDVSVKKMCVRKEKTDEDIVTWVVKQGKKFVIQQMQDMV